jgi:hypothetical protein
MKTNPTLAGWLMLPVLLTLNAQCSTAIAQGSLTPPGAPAATMKSLDQVYGRLDSRTPITNASSSYIISAPGSYYLTTNLTVSTGNGIAINANGVTLDLNGFTISSTLASASWTGIALSTPLNDITIVNGHIRSGVTNNGSGVFSGSGFNAGIGYIGTGIYPTNVYVSKISVSGVLNYGIGIGNNGNASVVEDCQVTTAGVCGINAATVKSSVAIDCRAGIQGDCVSDCQGFGGVIGIAAAATALNCYGQGVSTYGVSAGTAQNCYGLSSSGTGLYVTNVAKNCYGQSSSGMGLFSPTAIGCTGAGGSGVGMSATIANSCRIISGTTNITYKYNMP